MNIEVMAVDIKEEIKARIINENGDKSFASVVGAVYPELVMIGKGSFGAVFIHEEDANKVYRISFSPQFDSWFTMADYAMRTKSPLFPQIHSCCKTSMVGIAVIERLQQIPSIHETYLYNYQRAMLTNCDVEEEARYICTRKIGFTMDHHMELMNFKKYMDENKIIYRWDLYARNFMSREGSLVISDPIS